MNSYDAWCFDDAVYAWGNFVENELDKAAAEENKKKRKSNEGAARTRRLAQLLEMPDNVRFKSFRQSPGQFMKERKEE